MASVRPFSLAKLSLALVFAVLAVFAQFFSKNVKATAIQLSGRVVTQASISSAWLFGRGELRSAKSSAPSATITINTTADTVAADGFCSLREAIQAANTNIAVNECPAGIAGLDNIQFNLGIGTPTINVMSALPVITDPVRIDGATGGATRVELNGAGTEPGGSTQGLTIHAGNSTVQSLVINRFANDGIGLGGGGNNIIKGCILGLDASGTIKQGNGRGILITSGGNVIGGTTAAARNIISGNGVGIWLTGAAVTNTTIQGNFIGTDISGMVDLGNEFWGIDMGANNSLIGGTTAGAGNVISGNDSQGIRLYGSGHVVQGNLIGTNATGTAALLNGSGILLEASGSTIGGTTAAARNIISGNGLGMYIVGSTTANNVIQGNFIGTDITGTADLGNDRGIEMGYGPHDNLIGGIVPGAGNLISGNDIWGIITYSEETVNNLIQGNFIGTNAGGTGALGNGNTGVLIGSPNNTIGGTVSGAANIIAFNGSAGVGISAIGNRIQTNAIFSNGGLGIDLGGNGVTANDSCDGDTGGNLLQNFPVITQLTPNGANTNIGGTLNSAADQTFRVELFANDATDASGYGEGQTYLGAVNVTTGADCNGSFSLTVPSSMVTDKKITATATDSAGNTSEFSAAFPTTCPIITISPATILAGATGVVYSQTFTQVGGAGNVTFSLNGALPNGMAFANGALSGTPTQTGNFPITVMATDANGCTGSRSFLLVVGTSAASQSPSWIELAPTGTPPNPIYGSKPVHYDAVNNRLIAFFPGNPPHNPNPPGNGNEVWILTNANGLGGAPQWSKLQPTGTAPSSNLFESVVYDAATNRLIVYGGCFANCAPPLSGVFVLTNANGLGGPPVWTESTVTNPQTRASHSSVYDALNNLMISFAGQQAFFGTDQNDTRLLSNANGTVGPSTWTTLSTVGGPPPIRDEHTAIYDQASNRMTIFAGHNAITTCCPYVISDYNDLWTLSNANGQSGAPTWTQLSPAGSLPPVRTGHSAVYDPVNNRMLVFGGGQWNQTAQTTTPIGDLWQLSNANGLGGEPVWTQISQNCVTPGPRFYHTAAFDAANQRMIVLGGRDVNDQPSNRVWVLAPNCPTISISPTSLAQGSTGVPYSQSFTASGGSGPYTFALTGSLPDGMAFANGVLSGTPTQSGSFSFTVTATDQNGCSGCQSYTLVVSCPTVAGISPISGPVGSTVVITGTNFLGVTAVKFSNNLSAVFAINSDTQITATVPIDAVTGPIAISKPGCGDVLTTVFTVGPCINVSISNALTVPIGGSVSIPVMASDLSGRGILSYDFTVMFNPAVLQLQNPPIDTAGTLSGGMSITPNTGVPGKLTIAAFSTNPLSGAGTLLNLKFNVIGAISDCSALVWQSFMFNEGAPCATLANGQACVIGASISGTVSYCIAPAKKVPGVIVQTNGAPPVNGTTDNLGNYSLTGLNGGAVTVTPMKSGDVNGISSFDASLVAQRVAGLIAFGSCQEGAGDLSGNGSLSSFDAALIAQFAVGISSPGNTAGSWKFAPPNRVYASVGGDLTGQNYDALLMGDVSGNWIAPGILRLGPLAQVQVSLPNASGMTGASVTVPVTVETLTGQGFTSYDFDLIFDQNVLQLQNPPVDAADSLSSGLVITPNPTAGRLRVSGFGVTPLTGSGALLKLKFNVVGAPGTTTALTWQSFMFNEDAQSLLTNGSFNVPSACGTLSLSPASLPGGALGAAYNQTLTANGGAMPYTFSLDTGTLPDNVTLSSGGQLTGTPTQAGTFSFTVKATDQNGCPGTQSYTIVINDNRLLFYPLPRPVRLLETRAGFTGCDAPGVAISGNSSRTQTVAGRTCDGILIPANAKAVTGHITTVQSGGGFLTLYPSDAAQPVVASINYDPNEIVNNVFTVGLGAAGPDAGAFKIFAVSTTDVVVDVTGYYAPPATGGLYFHPLPSPIRLLETRSGFTGCNAPGAPLAGGVDFTQQAQGLCQGVTIPASARAIIGNATTVGPQAGGFLTMFPGDADKPLAASSNFAAGQIVNGPFTVGLGADGRFKIFPSATTDLVVDVLGYYSPEANDVNGAGLFFNPLSKPVRLLETRAGFGGCFTPGAALTGGQEATQTARGVCQGEIIPDNALGVIGNATVVNNGAGFLTVWPANVAKPLIATSNFAAGQVVNRHFAVGLGPVDGAFKMFSSVTTDLVVDVTGYFAP